MTAAAWNEANATGSFWRGEAGAAIRLPIEPGGRGPGRCADGGRDGPAWSEEERVYDAEGGAPAGAAGIVLLGFDLSGVILLVAAVVAVAILVVRYGSRPRHRRV
jgi:hypothetical protein